jgi:hypothetical protein
MSASTIIISHVRAAADVDRRGSKRRIAMSPFRAVERHRVMQQRVEGKKAAGAFVATLRKNFPKSRAREVHQRGAKYLGNDFRRARIAKIKQLCRSYKLTAERNIAEVKMKKALRMGLIGRHF